MVHNYKMACVFGGTGFIGRQIVQQLSQKGYLVMVATRIPERGNFLKISGHVGQIVPVMCDYNDPKSIAKAVEGCDVVINMVGILYERSKTCFQRLHAELPGQIAKACKKADVGAFIHISALGVDQSTSHYAQSKLSGEKAVMKGFEKATILRPSIVFGEDDSFFNMFAKLATLLPALPLIGGGKTLFQPVYVGDVAKAVMRCLKDERTRGHIYELGGPDIKSFKELFHLMFRYTEQERALIPLPFFIAKIEAFFLQLLPKPLLTMDQVESLKSDNIVGADALGLADLDIQPTSMDAILPTYLSRHRPGGRFGKGKE